MIVTFYSFKGGVGRSMALVNIAEILADRGYHVIACDWDLEAPGLERYFTSREVEGVPWQSNLQRLIAMPGLVDLLGEYRDSLAGEPLPSAGSSDDYATIGDVSVRRPSTAAVPVSTQLGTADHPYVRSGTVRLLSAGRRDGVYQQTYAEVVKAFDWEEFYSRWAGGSYIQFLRRDLVKTDEGGGAADILLVDSRTGFTEQGGVCTHHLADLVILMAAANDANLAGVKWMAEGLTDERLAELRGGRPLQVLPIAARIEQDSEKEELVDFRQRFVKVFRKYMKDASGVTLLPEDFALATEIPYRAFYAFTERVVAREPESRREQYLYNKYLQLADVIVANGISRNLLRDSAVRVERLQPRRAARRRRFTVYVSTPEPESPLAKTICAGLWNVGLDIVTRSDASDDVWNRVSHFIMILDGEQTPAQKAELAAMTRQAAVRSVRFRAVAAENAPSHDDLGVPILAPTNLTEDDVEYFGAFAAQIADSDATPLLRRRSAYCGDRSLTEDDAEIFFGRDAELADVAAKWPRANRWLEVFGDSGAGKTSFVMAGVLPMIRRGQMPGIPDDIDIVLVNDEHEFDAILPTLSQRTRQPTLLVIDVPEWRWRKSPAGRSVDGWLSAPEAFLITINAGSEAYSKAIHFNLPKFTLETAQTALVGPSILAGITWEAGVAERVVSDLSEAAVGTNGSIAMSIDPALLATVAGELTSGQSWHITHRQYDEGGPFGERVSRYAAVALTKISDPVRALALLTCLASSRGEPRRLPLSAAAEIVGGDDRLNFLDSMAKLRLVRIGSDVSLWHSLLAKWWIAGRQRSGADRERAAQVETLELARTLWEASGRLPSALPGGSVLELASAGAHDPASREFIQLARDRRQRRQRWLGFAAALLFLGGISLRNWILQHEQQGGTVHDGDFIATRSLATRDPLSALVAALAAGEKGDTPLTRQALRQAIINSHERARWTLPAAAVSLSISANGNRVLVVSGNGAVNVWDGLTGDNVFSRTIPGGGLDCGVRRDLLVVACRDAGMLRVERFDNRQPLNASLMNANLIHAFNFAVSPTRNEIAVTSAPGISIWDLDSNEWRKIDTEVQIKDLAFTPDGESIVGTSTNEGLNVWTRLHTPTYKPIRDFVAKAHDGGISSFAVSAAGDVIVTAGQTDRRVATWSLDPSKATIIWPTGWGLQTSTSVTVPRRSFINQDRHLVFVEQDRLHVWLFRGSEGMLLQPFDTITAFDADPKRAQLAVGAPDGSLEVLRLNSTEPPSITTLIGHTERITDAMFSADGLQLATADGKTVHLWSTMDAVLPDGFADLMNAARRCLPVTLTQSDRATILAETLGDAR